MSRPPIEPKVRVEGLREFVRGMERLGVAVSDMKEAAAQAAEPVVQQAKVLAPNLTGALEASIRAAGQRGGAVIRAGFAAVPYAGPIHFGWPAHGIEPQPFLYDALDQRREEVEQAYYSGLERLIDQKLPH